MVKKPGANISNCRILLGSDEEWINPFLVNVPILYTLKTPQNIWFSGIFRGYKMGTKISLKWVKAMVNISRSSVYEKGFK